MSNAQNIQKEQIMNLPMSAMNPFHADIMSLNEELHQQRLVIEQNQHQQHMLRTHIESSPKKTKSDSGLSSMSGFSSLEKSPNSPGNKQLHRQPVHYSSGSCSELPKHLGSGFNENDFMFSEENLNYIRELSKNVPICSVYENKSIFDEAEQQRSRKHSQGSSYQLSSSSASHYSSQGNFPDLVQDQSKDLKYYQDTHKSQQHAPSPSPSRRSLSRVQSYYDEPPIETEDDYKRSHSHQQKHKQLTDRLVFYPSSSKITDYNSSMNLDYTGRIDDARRQQQHQQQYNLLQSQAMSQDPKNFTNLDRHQQNIKHYMQTLQTIQGRSQDSRSYPRNGATTMRYGSLDSQAPALPAHQNQHSYILNQSGYVTISSDLTEKLQPQQSNHHQSAPSTSSHNHNNKLVSKISHWLPDLKLKKMSKRHRSHSLPAGVEIDDDIPQPTATRHQSNSSAQQKLRKDSSSSSGVSTNASTKKKKRSLVSTMSNIMQKAKSINRRHSFTHHSFTNPFSHHKHVGAYAKHPHSASLSDPEGDVHGFFSDNDDTTSTSEYEKQSLLDEYGGFGDLQHDHQQAMLFPTMSSVVKGIEQKSISEQVQPEPEVKKAPPQPPPPVSDSEDSGGEIFMNPMFATVGDAIKTYSGGENSGDDNSNDQNIVTATSTSITVVTPSPDPSSSNTTNGDPNNKFIFSSTSMEFAVSRKIAKYRQKNVSSDDINGQKHSDDGGDSGEAQTSVPVPPTTMTTPIKPPEHQKSVSHIGQLQKTHSIFVEDDNLPIDNYGVVPPSTEQQSVLQTARSNLLDVVTSDAVTVTSNSPRNYKFGQKSQQSLEIPSSRDDEDNRSQHSYRTMSSSRRQSTEDSIDTDDEYFVYELRKLEELERRSHMESSTYYDDGGHEVLNKIDQLGIDEDDEYTLLNERKSYQPDEDVKEKMSFVLNELKNVVKLQPEIKVNNVRRRSDAEKAQTKKSNVYEKFSHASDISWQNKTYDEDDDDFLGEIDQLEKEIQNQRYGKQQKPIKMRKKRRKSPNYGDSYDSDEPDEYSSTPYSSADEDEKERPGKTSRDSSEATSGPDSPCHFTDEDLDHNEAFRKMEDYDDFKERQKTEITASKNDVAVSPNDEAIRETGQRVDESSGIFEKRRISSDEQQNQQITSDELGVGESDVGEMGTETIKTVRKMPSEKMLSHESSQDSQNGALGSSKWKLLKTLKEKKIEEKNNQDKIKEEECTQKDKDKVNMFRCQFLLKLCQFFCLFNVKYIEGVS